MSEFLIKTDGAIYFAFKKNGDLVLNRDFSSLMKSITVSSYGDITTGFLADRIFVMNPYEMANFPANPKDEFFCCAFDSGFHVFKYAFLRELHINTHGIIDYEFVYFKKYGKYYLSYDVDDLGDLELEFVESFDVIDNSYSRIFDIPDYFEKIPIRNGDIYICHDGYHSTILAEVLNHVKSMALDDDTYKIAVYNPYSDLNTCLKDYTLSRRNAELFTTRFAKIRYIIYNPIKNKILGTEMYVSIIDKDGNDIPSYCIYDYEFMYSDKDFISGMRAKYDNKYYTLEFHLNRTEVVNTHLDYLDNLADITFDDEEDIFVSMEACEDNDDEYWHIYLGLMDFV